MCSVKVSRRLGNLDKEDDAEGICSKAFQLSSMRVGKEGSVNHICSNLKGLGGFRSLGSVESKMGQWSDFTLGRWYSSADGKRVAHSEYYFLVFCSFNRRKDIIRRKDTKVGRI